MNMLNIRENEITKEWKGKKIAVSINCITYNHELYIEEAIDSFLLQKTTFPYEIIVHDDCSTDRTAELLHKYESAYPSILKVVYEDENQWSKGNKNVFGIGCRLSRGKYIALCEGDDFWCDNNKLSKLKQILDKNNRYYACMHQTRIVDLNGLGNSLFYNIKQKSGVIYPSSYLDFPHTSSFFFRNPFFDKDNLKRIEAFEKVIGWDKTYALFFLSQGKIYYTNEIMSCYRIDLYKGSSYMAMEARNNIIIQKLQAEKDLQKLINYYGLNLDISKHYYINILIYELEFLFRNLNIYNIHGLFLGWRHTPKKIKAIFFIICFYLKKIIRKFICLIT